MVKSFDVGRFPAGSTPQVTTRQYAASPAQTFTKGAPLVFGSGGLLVEATSPHPTTGIVCIAGQDADSGYGFRAANNPNPITWQSRDISTYDLFNRTTQFIGRLVGAADAAVTPTQSMVGTDYGIKKVGSDWVIDTTETSDVAVTIINVEIEGEYVYFNFLASALSL